MKRMLCSVGLPLLMSCAVSDLPRQEADNKSAAFRFENGVWFDGQRFVGRRVDIVDGKLASAHPDRDVGTRIDLAGGYVIPPLCEAHNHNLGDSADAAEIEPVISAYLQYGVFYAMMQGSFDLYREKLAGRINHPRSIDVVFANNGLTGTGGHPRALRESLMQRYGNYPEFTMETLPDTGYFEADTIDEVREKMSLIISGEPDFVKVMLLFSEEYEERKDEPEFYGKRGLDPALLPEVVRLAHQSGLRVSVHVETDADMATALRAGADIIAHMPSHDAPVVISDETVSLAAETQAAVITTLSLANRSKLSDPDKYQSIARVQRENLKRLHVAGANLVLGSDNVRDVSVGEATYLEELGALDNLTLLTMWTENCVRTVFPDRQIGRLDEGYEASFLVLEADPLQDLKAVMNIRMRLKEGGAS